MILRDMGMNGVSDSKVLDIPLGNPKNISLSFATDALGDLSDEIYLKLLQEGK